MDIFPFDIGKAKLVASGAVKYVNLPGGKTRKDEVARILMRNASCSRYVGLVTNPAIPLTVAALYKKGRQNGKLHGRVGLGNLFALFCLGRSVSEALLVANIGNGVAAVVAIKDGVPFAESCGRPDEIAALGSEFFQYFTSGCNVYGDQELFEGTELTQLSISDIVTETLPTKEFAGLKISYYGVLPVFKILSTLLVAGAIAWYFYDMQETKRIKEARRKAEVAQQQEENNPVAVFGRAQESAYASAFQVCDHGEVMEFAKTVWPVQMHISGWSLKEIVFDCTGGNRVASLHWVRGESGTNESIGDAFPSMQINYSTDLASASIDVSMNPQSEESKQPIAVDVLPTFEGFMRKYGTLFQRATRIGIKVQVGEPAAMGGIAVPPEFSGTVFLQGDISASGSSEYLLLLLREIKNVGRIRRIVMTSDDQDGAPSFSLEGIYYAKKPEASVK